MGGRARLGMVVMLAGLCAGVTADGFDEKPEAPSGAAGARVGLFHPDPEHLWNRLHRHFTMRTARSGREYGFDSLDPLLWRETRYLLTGESHQRALRLLDEFLRVHGERLITDPTKQALLQRDLWAVFDWSAQTTGWADDPVAARAALRSKLGEVLWRLAPPAEQLHALPDNYRQAVASGKYAAEYAASDRTKPFLPGGLFDAHGPWVELTGLRGPAAPSHVHAFSGRSVFHVFLRLPGGRKATLDYVAKLWHFPRPWPTEAELDPPLGVGFPLPLSADVPQFSPGTQVALVRRLVLFDAGGRLMETAMTESVQIRVFREVPAGGTTTASLRGARGQDFFEFKLSRAWLLAEEAGGLRPVRQDEVEYPTFGAHGWDWFEKEALAERGPPALKCENCHNGPGIQSLRSVEVMFPPNPLIRDPAEGESGWDATQRESSATLYWKETRYDWGLLNAQRPLPQGPARR